MAVVIQGRVIKVYRKKDGNFFDVLLDEDRVFVGVRCPQDTELFGGELILLRLVPIGNTKFPMFTGVLEKGEQIRGCSAIL